ncbi:MAG: HesA/MoeB/ThiF family protein [Planctomycetes bacterium]|nr:HesA/MoeB/ThiF family protein [Planctomycetota bacterium]
MVDAQGFEAHSRYARNLLLKEVGEEGQVRLLKSSAFVVGAGGLGSVVLPYLASAGVGRIGLADNDAVEASNLNRQILYRGTDLGKRKATSASASLQALNPDCEVLAIDERIVAANIKKHLSGYGVVIDCSDNFATKFLVSDYCWSAKIPLVTAGVVAFSGQVMAVLQGEGNPCYRCLLPDEPPPGSTPESAAEGILGAAAGVLGSIQAIEAIKILLGIGSTLARRLLTYDGLKAEFRTFERTPNPDCPLCGTPPKLTKLG